MSDILLLACSAHKNRYLERGRADEIYHGSLFQVGMQLARENSLEVVILSAKYGFITPATIIDRYNNKLTKPYPAEPEGKWPSQGGFYIGGRLYFANAPARFTSVLQPNTPGRMVAELRTYVKDLKAVTKTTRIQKKGGKTWYLYQWLLERPHSVGELFGRLEQTFGPNPLMMQTIRTQLTQRRIGDERGCHLHSKEGNFWLTPKAGVNLL